MSIWRETVLTVVNVLCLGELRKATEKFGISADSNRVSCECEARVLNYYKGRCPARKDLALSESTFSRWRSDFLSPEVTCNTFCVSSFHEVHKMNPQLGNRARLHMLFPKIFSGRR
jgi:hypothetical protein